MNAVYILIIVAALFLIAVLSFRVRVFLEYKKYPGEKLYTDISLKLGFVNLSGLLKPRKKAKPEKTGEVKEPRDDSFFRKIQNYTETFVKLKKVYSKNRWHIQKSLIVENVDIHIKFGLYDAAQTGIATGALWSMLYSALALFDTLGTVKNHFFEVSPVFTEPGFISQGSIRISVRLINAASIALRLYLTYTKVSKDNK